MDGFGRTALVTGASSGIGRAVALALAASGWSIAATGRDAKRLEHLRDASGSDRVRVLRADLTNRNDTLSLPERALDAVGHLDAVILAAGAFSIPKRVTWTLDEDWDRVIALNLTAPFLLTRALLPHMIARGGGTIVAFASVAARVPSLLGGAAYGAAKAGLVNLMRSVADEGRDQGVRTITVVPGETDTAMHDLRPVPPNADQRATMLRAEDVANVVLTCLTLPARAMVEEVVIVPTHRRDLSRDLASAALEGAPPSGHRA